MREQRSGTGLTVVFLTKQYTGTFSEAFRSVMKVDREQKRWTAASSLKLPVDGIHSKCCILSSKKLPEGRTPNEVMSFLRNLFDKATKGELPR